VYDIKGWDPIFLHQKDYYSDNNEGSSKNVALLNITNSEIPGLNPYIVNSSNKVVGNWEIGIGSSNNEYANYKFGEKILYNGYTNGQYEKTGNCFVEYYDNGLAGKTYTYNEKYYLLQYLKNSFIVNNVLYNRRKHNELCPYIMYKNKLDHLITNYPFKIMWIFQNPNTYKVYYQNINDNGKVVLKYLDRAINVSRFCCYRTTKVLDYNTTIRLNDNDFTQYNEDKTILQYIPRTIKEFIFKTAARNIIRIGITGGGVSNYLIGPETITNENSVLGTRSFYFTNDMLLNEEMEEYIDEYGNNDEVMIKNIIAAQYNAQCVTYNFAKLLFQKTRDCNFMFILDDGNFYTKWRNFRTSASGFNINNLCDQLSIANTYNAADPITFSRGYSDTCYVLTEYLKNSALNGQPIIYNTNTRGHHVARSNNATFLIKEIYDYMFGDDQYFAIAKFNRDSEEKFTFNHNTARLYDVDTNAKLYEVFPYLKPIFKSLF